MSDPPDANLYPGDDTDVDPGGSFDTGPTRWVKLFGIIALAVVLLFVIALLNDGGRHGPSRHTGNEVPPTGVTEHTPPADSHAP